MTLPPNSFYYSFAKHWLIWWQAPVDMTDPWRPVNRVVDLVSYLETTKTKMNHWPCAN